MPYYGHWLYFPKGSVIAQNVQRHGDFEAETRKLMLALARENTTVFDVGANIGWLSTPLLSLFSSINVISFEPSPLVIPYLKKTWQSSKYQNRWKIVEKALGNAMGTTDFSIHKQAGGDTFDGIRTTGRAGIAQTVTVAISTLDAEWQALGHPSVSLIKIDVEGAELWVLEGGLQCITACRPAILTEWSPMNLDAYSIAQTFILDWAMKNAYTIYIIPHMQRIQDANDLKAALLVYENLLLLPK